jgi:hypothetical protein
MIAERLDDQSSQPNDMEERFFGQLTDWEVNIGQYELCETCPVRAKCLTFEMT